MATLQLNEIKPFGEISSKMIPMPQRDAIHQIFLRCKEGVWLVGGTAISGYYASHRISDDIDLFTCGGSSQERAVGAIKSLAGDGAKIIHESHTPFYYKAVINWREHQFTADAVVDENLHKTGRAIQTGDGTVIADLETLFAMKIACLVSRCSEKDLFDLEWIMGHIDTIDMADFIDFGAKIDGGVSSETLLISLKGSNLNKEACRFVLPDTKMNKEKTFKKIKSFQRDLINRILVFEKKRPPSPQCRALSKAVKEAAKLKKS